MSNVPARVRRVVLSVELYSGQVETLEMSDPKNVHIAVSNPDAEADFGDVMSSPYRFQAPEPITVTVALSRKGCRLETGMSPVSRQQELAMMGKAEGQCGECGSYRLDGRPPLLHRQGCPNTVEVGSVRDWWTHELISGDETT